MVLGTVANLGIDVQGATMTAIDTGAINLLADVQTTSFTEAHETGFTTYLGADPMPPPCNGSSDTTCGHQLSGGATFTVPALSAHDAALPGSVHDGTFTQGPGQLSIQIALGSPPIACELDLFGARTELTGVSADGITDGIVGGAATFATLNLSCIPAFVGAVVAYVQRDCCGTPTSPQPICNYNSTPSCGCSNGSMGQNLLGQLDIRHACTVTVADVENNSFIESLLAPDVMIDGVPGLSFGVGFTAVSAVYTPYPQGSP